jgi:hypothetical protein
MKKHMISLKLPAALIEELKAVAVSNGITLYQVVESWLKGRSGLCPCCGRRWPKETEPKVSFTSRVDPKITESIDSKDIPSRYYSAVIHEKLGYCPVCSQKKTK